VFLLLLDQLFLCKNEMLIILKTHIQMECTICMSEYPVNTGVICVKCGFRFCNKCHTNLIEIKCPNCRDVSKNMVAIGDISIEVPKTTVVQCIAKTIAGPRCKNRLRLKQDGIQLCSVHKYFVIPVRSPTPPLPSLNSLPIREITYVVENRSRRKWYQKIMIFLISICN
jgi:hypothetical protein